MIVRRACDDPSVGESLQERDAGGSTCFGCGPANPYGLHVRGVVDEDATMCDRLPAAHQEACPGMVDGGVLVEGTLSGDGEVTAVCRGSFAAVRGGHPAFHRW